MAGIGVIVPTRRPRALARRDVAQPASRAHVREMVAASTTPRRAGRERALRAARDRFYTGDIAREVVAFQRETRLRDANGFESSGLLTEDDFAAFETRIEAPVTVNYRGYDVYKCGPWTQGPAFLQALNILEGWNCASRPPPRIRAHCVDTLKLVFADTTIYGDPAFWMYRCRPLSKEYRQAPRLLDLARAMLTSRPGDPYPRRRHSEAPVQLTGPALAGQTTVPAPLPATDDVPRPRRTAAFR